MSPRTLTTLSTAEALRVGQRHLGYRAHQLLWVPSTPDQAFLMDLIRSFPDDPLPAFLHNSLCGFASDDYDAFVTWLHEHDFHFEVPRWSPGEFGSAGKLKYSWNWQIAGDPHPLPFSANAFKMAVERDALEIVRISRDGHPLLAVHSREGLITYLHHSDQPVSGQDALTHHRELMTGGFRGGNFTHTVIPAVEMIESKTNTLVGMSIGQARIFWSMVWTYWKMNRDGGDLTDETVTLTRKGGIGGSESIYVLEPPFTVVQLHRDYPNIPPFSACVTAADLY